MKSIVNQSEKISNKSQIFFGLMLLLIIILIAINPAKYSSVAFKGLEIWAKILVPSLLPFFILTKLFASLGVIEHITKVFAPITKTLYNCPSDSSYVFLMSALSGYPVGSKLVCDLYLGGKLSKNQAIRTTAFTSNSGPMFILGSVAIGMFSNRTLGLVILTSHLLGSLLNGIIYRNYGAKNDDLVVPSKLVNSANFDFSASVVSSVNSIMLIGGVICFTFVLLEVITTSKLFSILISVIAKLGIDKNIFASIICGIGEITKGCLMLSTVPLSGAVTCCLLTFIISFGGISTFLQARAFLKDIVPCKIFLLQKITHALLATAICFLLCLLI